MSDPTDHELVTAALSGNEEALRALIDRHLQAVYTFCIRYAGNPDDAADAANETFVKAWKKLGSYDPARSFRTWILAISRNAAIDLLRAKRTPALADLPPVAADALIDTLEDPEPLPDELLERAMRAGSLRKALFRLPNRERTLLSLRYEEELSFEEIAGILRMPATTVRSVHRRSLAKLRKLLES